MNIPKPALLLLALAAAAYFKPWERLPSPTPSGPATPWITPYAAPANPADLAAIRAEAKKSPQAAALLASFYQIFGDMILSDSQGSVIASGADVRRAAEMGFKLLGGKPMPVPSALLNNGANVGLVDQYIKRQCGDAPAALTPEARQKFSRAYRDVAWALEQEAG